MWWQVATKVWISIAVSQQNVQAHEPLTKSGYTKRNMLVFNVFTAAAPSGSLETYDNLCFQ